MGFEREKPWDSEEEIATNFGRLPGHQRTATEHCRDHCTVSWLFFAVSYTNLQEMMMMAVQQKHIRYKVVNGAPSDSQFACQPKWSLIKSMVGQTFAFDLIDFWKKWCGQASKVIWPHRFLFCFFLFLICICAWLIRKKKKMKRPCVCPMCLKRIEWSAGHRTAVWCSSCAFFIFLIGNDWMEICIRNGPLRLDWMTHERKPRVVDLDVWSLSPTARKTNGSGRAEFVSLWCDSSEKTIANQFDFCVTFLLFFFSRLKFTRKSIASLARMANEPGLFAMPPMPSGCPGRRPSFAKCSASRPSCLWECLMEHWTYGCLSVVVVVAFMWHSRCSWNRFNVSMFVSRIVNWPAIVFLKGPWSCPSGGPWISIRPCGAIRCNSGRSVS